MGISKTRVATSANLKSKKNASLLRSAGKDGSGGHNAILLARGLSARYCGANVPFTSLTADEVERDLRHMEAFSNACIAYAQQYYIYQNSAVAAVAQAADDEKNGSKKQPAPAPLIAMPVRIDPEEEKRLTNLRLKIQLCEAQRELLESQYLSLRAHYVYMSQRLKNTRKTVNGRVQFLQSLVQKRAKLVALQRARLQISREVLACLHYRQSGGKAQTEDNHSADLVETWNKIDEQFKQAEEDCRGDGVEPWQALKVPRVPRGVPLLLSQLAKPAAFAAAWSTAGMFGSKDDSMCWLEPDFPEPAHRTKSLPALREEVDFLKRELDKEHEANRNLQTDISGRRKANIELVAMMALLRTETEAVVARHNILLESDEAKDAALKLQQEEDEAIGPAGNTTVTHDEQGGVAQQQDPADGAVPTALSNPATNPAVVDPSLEAAAADATTTPGAAATKKPEPNDEANDGDDEGEAGEEDEEDEGEILEGGGVASEKRGLEDSLADSSSRNKRRRL